MNGQFEKPDETAQQCDYCGLWFDRRGVNAHEMNCRFEGRDLRILPQEDSGGDPPEDTPTPESPESPDGTHGGVEDSPPTPNGGVEKPTRADGGPGLGLEGPPAPSSPEPTPSSGGGEAGARSVDDLPDRFVDVDEFVAEVRSRAEHVDADALEDHLAEFDVVDTEETDEERIAAFTLDEVRT